MKLLEKPISFVADVRQEMSKVSWPTYEELKSSTIVVIVLFLLLTVYVFTSDTILQFIMHKIF
ncbi:MAG: preprotein translocase subunit SecE [bacterium]